MNLNIGKEVKPQKSRVVMNTDSLNNMAKSVNTLRKLDFDNNQFLVSKFGDGIHIGLRATEGGDETHPHRWTLTDTSNAATSTYTCTVGNGTCDVMSEVIAWNVGDGDVDSLALGDNLIYGYSQRDGGGGILFKANAGSTVMPSQSELGNNTFGFAVGTVNTASKEIVQYLHSDFSVQYPKEKHVLYKIIALREYNEKGELVAVGSETDPLPAGHYHEQTWDWVRAHS